MTKGGLCHLSSTAIFLQKMERNFYIKSHDLEMVMFNLNLKYTEGHEYHGESQIKHKSHPIQSSGCLGYTTRHS